MDNRIIDKMPKIHRVLGNRSIKALSKVIKNDEEIHHISLCSTYTKYYLLVATSKRVFYLRKSFSGKIDLRSADYGVIQGVKLIKGIIKNKVQLITNHSDHSYRFENPIEAVLFVSIVTEKVNINSSIPTSIETNNDEATDVIEKIVDNNISISFTTPKINNNTASTNKRKYIRSQKLVSDYVVIDFETTGLRPVEEEIIQIGAVKYNNHIKIDQFYTFVKPTKKISNRITQITGITNNDLKFALPIDNVIDDLIDFIGDNTLIAHNASFDMGFLYALENKGFTIPPYKVLDTLSLSRKTISESENHKLVTLAKHLGIKHNAHDALGDCLATAEVYQHCFNKQINNKDKNSFVQKNKETSSLNKTPAKTKSKELNAVEILMLGYANGLNVDEKNFPGYWKYQYDSVPQKLIKKLLALELLEVDTSVRSSMNSVLYKLN